MNDKSTPQAAAGNPVGEALGALPQLTPPPALTGRIDALVEAAATDSATAAGGPHTRRWFALAATAAIAVWVALPRLAPERGIPSQPGAVRATAGEVAVTGADASGLDEAAAIDELMARSRYLESVLDTVPRRGRVQRVGTASTITALEDRVAYIDAQLSASGLAADAGGRAVLWRERVGLMTTLVSLQAPPARSVTL